MSQKVYARTTGDESWVDWEGYMEPYIEDGSIILEGGKDLVSFNNEVFKDIDKLINDYEYDGIQNCLECYLKKENGKKYSPVELHKVKAALEEKGLQYYNYIENLRLIILSIIKGKKYEIRPIRGSSQGDYADLYVEEDLAREVSNDIEAIYFGTGTEIVIDDSEKEIVDPKDISGYAIYTSKYNEDDLKEEVADYVGCNVEDVVLWLHNGYTKVSKYKLAEQEEKG